MRGIRTGLWGIVAVLVGSMLGPPAADAQKKTLVVALNQDPDILRNLLLYKLTLAAQKRIDSTPLTKRAIARRLGTSPAQLYRLLDQTNYRKSVDRLLALLQVLDCEVDLVVRAKGA